jgi:hypothetical protein
MKHLQVSIIFAIGLNIYHSLPVFAGGESDINCYQSNINTKVEECSASVYAIIANPNKFDGKIVRVTGYVRRTQDIFVLYASRDFYKYSAGKYGIEIWINSSEVDLQDVMTVIGRFTNTTRGRLQESVGVIDGDVVLLPEFEMGERPPVPRP